MALSGLTTRYSISYPLSTDVANLMTDVVDIVQDIDSVLYTNWGPLSNPTFATITGNGAGLTSLTAANLAGTIPSAVLGNSSMFIGTTSVPLNRASASLTLAGLVLTTPASAAYRGTSASAAAQLWDNSTTAILSIGAGLTTGTLNIAAAGTGVTPINIGHTNSVITVVGTTTHTGNMGIGIAPNTPLEVAGTLRASRSGTPAQFVEVWSAGGSGLIRSGGTIPLELGAGATHLTISTAGVVTLANALPVGSGGTGVTASTGTTSVVLSDTPTISSPIIRVIDSTASGATSTLWANITTGSIAVGAGLTTGALNIAASGTGATPIAIGHTNAITTMTGATATLTFATSINLNSALIYTSAVADTATAASHYFVETATDGALRPKTLANVMTEIVTTAAVNSAAATTVGTVTSGTWSASFGAVSGANLTSLTAANLSGTIPSAVLGASSVFIGTTSIALNRTSAALTLAGITLTTPTIDAVVSSAAGATNTLWSATTTGSIAIGAGLTTGAINIATVGTGVTPIAIGHTNATILLTGNTTVVGSLLSSSLATNGTELRLNNNQAGAPTLNGLITVERGSSADVSIRWNETSDAWEYTNDGTTFVAIGSGSGGSPVAAVGYEAVMFLMGA